MKSESFSYRNPGIERNSECCLCGSVGVTVFYFDDNAGYKYEQICLRCAARIVRLLLEEDGLCEKEADDMDAEKQVADRVRNAIATTGFSVEEFSKGLHAIVSAGRQRKQDDAADARRYRYIREMLAWRHHEQTDGTFWWSVSMPPQRRAKTFDEAIDKLMKEDRFDQCREQQ